MIDPTCPTCGTPWAWIKDTGDLKHGGRWVACCGCEAETVIDIENQESEEKTE